MRLEPTTCRLHVKWSTCGATGMKIPQHMIWDIALYVAIWYLNLTQDNMSHRIGYVMRWISLSSKAKDLWDIFHKKRQFNKIYIIRWYSRKLFQSVRVGFGIRYAVMFHYSFWQVIAAVQTAFMLGKWQNTSKLENSLQDHMPQSI